MAINPQVQALFTLLGINTQTPNEITGTAGVDILNGTAGSDYILGLGGPLDIINGGGGTDYLEGGAGINTINGDGFDTAGYANASTGVTVRLVLGTATSIPLIGRDTFAHTLTGINNVVGSNHNDDILGNNGNNVLAGLNGNDRLDGAGGGDILIGGAGADTLIGGSGDDTADYSTSPGRVVMNMTTSSYSLNDAAGDTLSGIEHLTGSPFNDLLIGSGAYNFLKGGAGNDEIYGEGGNDTLTGGTGGDELSGGQGADIFRYESLTDSPNINNGDRILDFSGFAGGLGNGDKIDLSRIDANTAQLEDQAFTVLPVGSSFTNRAGELRIGQSRDGSGNGVIEADVNGDGVADLAIFTGSIAGFGPSSGDLIL